MRQEVEEGNVRKREGQDSLDSFLLSHPLNLQPDHGINLHRHSPMLVADQDPYLDEKTRVERGYRAYLVVTIYLQKDVHHHWTEFIPPQRHYNERMRPLITHASLIIQNQNNMGI